MWVLHCSYFADHLFYWNIKITYFATNISLRRSLVFMINHLVERVVSIPEEKVFWNRRISTISPKLFIWNVTSFCIHHMRLYNTHWVRRVGGKDRGTFEYFIRRVSQEECARLRESVPYVKVYWYNPNYFCNTFNFGYRCLPISKVERLRR